MLKSGGERASGTTMERAGLTVCARRVRDEFERTKGWMQSGAEERSREWSESSVPKKEAGSCNHAGESECAPGPVRAAGHRAGLAVRCRRSM